MEEKKLHSSWRLTDGWPPLNRAEAGFCLTVLGIFSVQVLLLSIAGKGREGDATVLTIIMSLFYILLALLPIGISMELAYRRRSIHWAVVICLLVTVFMWIMFAGTLFPGGHDYPH